MREPRDVQAIGNEVAIVWEDGSETYYPMDKLRAASPSAETAGERDLLGQQIGGDRGGKDYSGVTVRGWTVVGGYALQFEFSDGHNTGLYTYDYLRDLGQALKGG